MGWRKLINSYWLTQETVLKKRAPHIKGLKTKPKASWRVIRRKRKYKIFSFMELTVQANGGTFENLKEVTNHFNKYFTTIAEKALESNNQESQVQKRNPYNHITKEQLYLRLTN